MTWQCILHSTFYLVLLLVLPFVYIGGLATTAILDPQPIANLTHTSSSLKGCRGGHSKDEERISEYGFLAFIIVVFCFPSSARINISLWFHCKVTGNGSLVLSRAVFKQLKRTDDDGETTS